MPGAAKVLDASAALALIYNEPGAGLATAHVLGIPAMTADRNWRGLDLPVEIEFIR